MYKDLSFVNADCDNAVSSDKVSPNPPETAAAVDTLYVEYEGYE